jgi:hypothetical protein
MMYACREGACAVVNFVIWYSGFMGIDSSEISLTPFLLLLLLSKNNELNLKLLFALFINVCN